MLICSGISYTNCRETSSNCHCSLVIWHLLQVCEVAGSKPGYKNVMKMHNYFASKITLPSIWFVLFHIRSVVTKVHSLLNSSDQPVLSQVDKVLCSRKQPVVLVYFELACYLGVFQLRAIGPIVNRKEKASLTNCRAKTEYWGLNCTFLVSKEHPVLSVNFVQLMN